MHRAVPKKKPLSVLDKKIPKNPRFADIKARVNSGLTVDKIHVVTTREYLRRRNETFARVRPSQLQELFMEYEEEVEEDIGGTRQACDGPRVVTHEVEDAPRYERPYLILDVRTPQEFQECHIVQARNYPHQYLNQDRITAELLKYKNKEGTLIILYDEEERLAGATASQFIEKGFVNVYILTGGLAEFAEEYPHYVEGKLPRAQEGADRVAPLGLCQEALEKLSMSRSLRKSLDGRSVAGCSATSRATSRLARSARTERSSRGPLGGKGAGGAVAATSLVPYPSARASTRAREADAASTMSVRSNMSVAESIIARAQAKKGSF